MLTAAVNLKLVEQAMDVMLRRGQNLLPAMRLIGKDMRARTRAQARAKEGPAGKWPARAPSTMAAARKGSGRSRRFPMGRLTSAIKYVVDARRVVGRSLVWWSGSHQEGDTVGNGAKLPARPFLWISDALVDRSAIILGRFLVNGWGR